jgi:hypothetical protein
MSYQTVPPATPHGPTAPPPGPPQRPSPLHQPESPWGRGTPPRPRRERLPEWVAGIGGVLVALAVTGFLASSWEDITQVQKAMALAVAAAVLTAAGLWADRARRLEPVLGTCWATATVLVVATVALLGAELGPGSARLVTAAAGVAGGVHAGLLLARRRTALLQQASLLGALVYAAGPVGTAASDAWSALGAARLALEPLLGFVDPAYASPAFLVTGVAYLAIGAAWIGLARVLDGRAGVAAKVVGCLVLAHAALQLNLVGPVGSVVALAVVLGFLLYGLAADEAGLLVAGVAGCVIAGVRVLAALFTGKALVTVLVFCGGLAMLGWAFAAMRRRQGSWGRSHDAGPR